VVEVEVTRMKLRVVATTLVALVLGCSGEHPSGTATAESTTASVANSVDEAIADAETGRDPALSRTRLEALLADATLPKADHAKVALALSRLVESTDRERAISLVEDAIASGDEDEASNRLFQLLTGKEIPSSSSRRIPQAPTAQSALALARYFPAATPARPVEIDIEKIGVSDERAPWPSGTFDIASVLREQAIGRCGACDDVKTNIRTSTVRSALWTSIPARAAQLERALVVLYVDAQTIPPARYERWMAASIAEVKEAIESGDGLVAVKERSGAPPLVLIAAPRAALLPTVEAKFAETSDLPLIPKRIALEKRLSNAEIQDGVRRRFGAFRTCYEELQTRTPTAQGQITMSFTVVGTGAVTDVTNTVSGTIDDATFRSCMTSAMTRTVRYVSWSRDPHDITTVKYPIVFQP
jgi:hypothetical protein